MGWVDIKTVLLGEWDSIAGPRLFLAVGLLAATIAIWLVANWRYAGLVDSLRSQLKAAEARNRKFEEALPGRTPAEAAARLRQLEAYVASLPARRLTDEQQQLIVQSAPPPPAACQLAIVHDSAVAEVARYAGDFLEAYSLTPGWNVVEESYPMTPRAHGSGVGVGVADVARPSPTEALVLATLRDAGITYDLMPKAMQGAAVEIIVTAR